jgi:hypothetical protein
MKLTKFPAVLLLVVVGGALVTYAAGQQKSAAVRFVPNGALLCGVQLSDEDWKALDKILKHFDRSLYKIAVVENRQAKSTIGSLQDVYIKREARSAAAKMQAGPHGLVYQIGFDWNEFVQHPTPTPPAKLDRKGSEELVRRVTPILQKYSRQ